MRMLKPISADWSWQRSALSPDRMGNVFGDFDLIVDSLLFPTYANTVNFRPSCDVSETNEHYLISFDMPGVKKEDIKIEIQGNELVISGERQRELKDDNSEARIRHEKVYGRFERSFALPTSIASDKIEAQYENGVLDIVLPKAEEAKSRTVQIQTGQNGLLSKFLGSKKESIRDAGKNIKVS